jgi:hypothetical protein
MPQRLRHGQLAVVAVAFVALALAGAASGYDLPARLNEVAKVYSLGVGEIRCPTPAEWNDDFGSSRGDGYTNLRADYAVLSPEVCEGALGVGSAAIPDWQEALGVLVLTHESFHLRHWRWRRNEGKVECQALVYFREAAVRLGATPSHAHELYAYALGLHAYQVSLFPQYRDKSCRHSLWSRPLPAE